MSLATRLARAAANSAGAAWRAHRATCSQCNIAMRRRRDAELCPQGRQALEIRRELDAQADLEHAADQLPSQDQGVLFR